jgi:acetate kinase
VPLFESFGQDSVESIVEGSELRTFEGNESIIQCGDEGRFIGVLIDGHGEISIADNTGGRIVMSPLEGATCSAKCRC